MKTNQQVIEELKTERDELRTRFNKLTDFIDTKSYSQLSSRQQNLIQTQWYEMDKYIEALSLRISDMEAKYD